jgi:hypothetical protein
MGALVTNFGLGTALTIWLLMFHIPKRDDQILANQEKRDTTYQAALQKVIDVHEKLVREERDRADERIKEERDKCEVRHKELVEGNERRHRESSEAAERRHLESMKLNGETHQVLRDLKHAWTDELQVQKNERAVARGQLRTSRGRDSEKSGGGEP